MASCRSSYSDPTQQNPSNSGGGGVCMMSTKWRDEQHPSFINFISSFLTANSFRLNFVLIAPDLIFNCGGMSVSFIFVTNWDFNDNATIFNRVKKLKEQFAHLYVVVTLPTREQNESFIRSYFKYGMQLGRPTFLPVQDIEMGFEKIVKAAHCRGGKKSYSPKLFSSTILFKKFIECHVNQAIGSIQAIVKASKEYILENTDLSAEKAETVVRFFRDPKLYLGPKIN
ncbi:hypothetical protein LWI29_025157 [Acer saccharum]|uniref:Protein PARTING DANCERS n=1 Tax=Acer saccharum TaxID=4024 RepID=A0AA39RMG6_ACESA|nr:hypothetical protein LWI29_025157 [Acer saccharum]